MRGPRRLVISKRDRDAIVDHCLRIKPREACGILAGRGDVVERVVFMANAAENPEERSRIDDFSQQVVCRSLRAENLELVALFHSHPNTEAYPSAADRLYALFPNVAYVIVSVSNDPVIRAFRIKDDEVSEIPILVQ